jgi:hypothetical protein
VCWVVSISRNDVVFDKGPIPSYLLVLSPGGHTGLSFGRSFRERGGSPCIEGGLQVSYGLQPWRPFLLMVKDASRRTRGRPARTCISLCEEFDYSAGAR